jgi:hypothetical protein
VKYELFGEVGDSDPGFAPAIKTPTQANVKEPFAAPQVTARTVLRGAYSLC